MGNPLSNEEQIYSLIEQEKVYIHPLFEELLSHHIGNDLHIIMLTIEVLRSVPAWILKVASFIIKFLCKIFRPKKIITLGISEIQTRVISHSKNIDDLLRKLIKLSGENRCLSVKEGNNGADDVYARKVR